MDFGDETYSKEEVDPAAEFLAREQIVLGDLESEINTGTNAEVGSASMVDNLIGNNGSDGQQGDRGQETSLGSFEVIGGESNEPIGISGPPSSCVEPDKIRKWREEQEKRLAEKDREEELKKDELKKQAKRDLEEWLRHTEESIAKTKAASRSTEKQSTSTENIPMEPGTEWERIAKLCDFNPKVNKSGKDVSRMRSIYLHLKQEPLLIQKGI